MPKLKLLTSLRVALRNGTNGTGRQRILVGLSDLMSDRECTSTHDVRHEPSFEKRTMLFILGHSLRHYYALPSQTESDRVHAALHRLAQHQQEAR